MPSRAKPSVSRLKPGPVAGGDICVFGDSHIGSLKQAFDGGLIDTGGRKLAFWGADGPSFRGLRWKNGRIVPDKAAREMVMQVSGGGRETLGPEDFELFVFYGARLRVHEFFSVMLEHMRRPEGFVSDAAMRAIARRWCRKTRAWRFAGAFAAAGARLAFVPTSFPSEGVLEAALEKKRLQIRSTRAERAALWRLLGDVAAEQGFGLIPQPEETVTGKTLTRARYAISGAKAAGDAVHKTPEFAAIMMEQALAMADQRQVRAAE